jgi:hypothetical protein
MGGMRLAVELRVYNCYSKPLLEWATHATPCSIMQFLLQGLAFNQHSP